MTVELHNDETLTRYLLAELPEEEAAEVERAYFADDRLFERLEAADHELIDAYLAGELGPKQLEEFEQQLADSAVRRERVDLARSLHAAAAARTRRGLVRQMPFSRSGPEVRLTFVAAAAAVLALAGIVWLSSVDAGLRRTIAQDSERQARLEGRIADLERRGAESQPLLSKSSSPPGLPEPTPRDLKIASFLLTSGLSRGLADGNRLAVTGGVDLIRLDLALESNAYKTYRALLSKPEGQLVWSRDRLEPRLQKGVATVALLLPAASIPAGDYILSLEAKTPSGAWEPAQDFSFRLVRR